MQRKLELILIKIFFETKQLLHEICQKFYHVHININID